MDISESHKHFAVKIAPKPGGGFVSSSDNPALILEGATEAEVREKVLQKIGELGSPEIAAMFRDMAQPGGEKKINVVVNKKTSFSFRRGSDGDDDESSVRGWLAGESQERTPNERAFSAWVKGALIVAILILLLWFAFQK